MECGCRAELYYAKEHPSIKTVEWEVFMGSHTYKQPPFLCFWLGEMHEHATLIFTLGNTSRTQKPL